MILIAVSCALLALVVKTILRVIAVHAAAIHKFFSALPVFDSKRAIYGITLIMPLRSTESGKRDLMAIADLLGNIYEIVPSFELCALNITVTPFPASENADSPAVLHHSGRYIETYIIEVIITHAVPYRTALFGIKAAGRDVDGTTD